MLLVVAMVLLALVVLLAEGAAGFTGSGTFFTRERYARHPEYVLELQAGLRGHRKIMTLLGLDHALARSLTSGESILQVSGVLSGNKLTIKEANHVSAMAASHGRGLDATGARKAVAVRVIAADASATRSEAEIRADTFEEFSWQTQALQRIFTTPCLGRADAP